MVEFIVRNITSGELLTICGYTLLDAMTRYNLDPECWWCIKMIEFTVRNIVSGELLTICGYTLLDAMARSDLDPECWALVGHP